jgi:hypothetical protein
MGRTSIGVSDETKAEFIRIKGKLLERNGKEHSEDSVMKEMMKCFKQKLEGQ